MNDEDDMTTEEILTEIWSVMVEQKLRTPTLRDQFAMAALTMLGGKEYDGVKEEVDLALKAYRIADAMLVARKK